MGHVQCGLLAVIYQASLTELIIIHYRAPPALLMISSCGQSMHLDLEDFTSRRSALLAVFSVKLMGNHAAMSSKKCNISSTVVLLLL